MSTAPTQNYKRFLVNFIATSKFYIIEFGNGKEHKYNAGKHTTMTYLGNGWNRSQEQSNIQLDLLTLDIPTQKTREAVSEIGRRAQQAYQEESSRYDQLIEKYNGPLKSKIVPFIMESTGFYIKIIRFYRNNSRQS
jgi:hypothetical protein